MPAWWQPFTYDGLGGNGRYILRIAEIGVHSADRMTYVDVRSRPGTLKTMDAHVRRLLRFGYLAPDIIEAIVEGRQPRSLTVKRLLKEARGRTNALYSDSPPELSTARSRDLKTHRAAALRAMSIYPPTATLKWASPKVVKGQIATASPLSACRKTELASQHAALGSFSSQTGMN